MSLYELIVSKSRVEERIAFASGDHALRWGEIVSLTEELIGRLSPFAGKRVGLIMRPQGVSYACLASLDKINCDTILISDSADPKIREQIIQEFFLNAVIDPGPSGQSAETIIRELGPTAAQNGQGRVVILTSGTSGKPKGVQHTWDSLLRPVRTGMCGEFPVWFASYAPNLYAGLQVACQSIADSATMVYRSNIDTFSDLPELFAKYGVEFAAGTPSFWRNASLFYNKENSHRNKVKQITLGGENIDQNIIDNLHVLFPEARLIHIYATTELGRCFSVTDGRAGFPLRFCDKISDDGVQLKIDNGQLHVRSANAMIGYDRPSDSPTNMSKWFATGDLVTIEDDRVFFTGRVSEIINVGGNKVNPIEVENIIRSIKGVLNVRVYPQKSALLGYLVACDIVRAKEMDEDQLRKSIVATCQSQFNAYHVPRFINFVDNITLSDAGKIVRR